MQKRLKEIRRTLDLNQTEFAGYLGITQSAWSMIENGSRPLSAKYMNRICSIFHVSEKWLRDGEGEMFYSTPYEEELTEIFCRLKPQTQKYLLVMARELLKLKE